jgi:hypothetical protein
LRRRTGLEWQTSNRSANRPPPSTMGARGCGLRCTLSRSFRRAWLSHYTPATTGQPRRQQPSLGYSNLTGRPLC